MTTTTRRWLVAVVALNAILLYQTSAPWLFVLVGSLMLWGSAWPLLRYLRHERGTLPFLPALAVVYFISYGLPTFGGDAIARNLRIPEAPVFEAALLSLGGEIALLVAFYSFPLRQTRSMLTLRLDLSKYIPRLFLAACAFTAVRVALGAGFIGETGGQLSVALADLSLVCTGGLYLCWLRGLLSPAAKLLTAFAILFLLFLELGSGSLAKPLFVAGMLFFVYFAERGRLPATAIGLCLGLLIPFMATKMEFRRLAWAVKSELNRTGLE